MGKRILLGLAVAWLSACGGGGTGEPAAGAPSAPPKPTAKAEAVVRTPDFESGEMKLIERRYVDGVAFRIPEGAAVLLSPTPMDACTRLAVLARDSADFSAFATADAPALAVVRNAEYPQGSVHYLEQGSTTFLSQAIPSLHFEGERFVAKGQETHYGTDAGKPSLEFDVDLPYASIKDFDALAADAGPEAAWLRGLAKQAVVDGAEAVVAATFLENEEDWTSYSARSTWFDVLANWTDLNVIAAGGDADCATLVVQAPGFSGGWRKAILRARGPADQRKVYAAESSDDYAGEGTYFVGRVEHPTLGAFPIMDARAENLPDLGTVLIFSDKPIGEQTWEQLVQAQRVVRATTSASFGTNYMLGSLEFAGPGVAAETVPAETISNAYVDETSISGLIKQGGEGAPRIVANYRLALKPLPTP